MAKKDVLNFSPDSNFFEFAKDFSEKYFDLSVGTYCDDNLLYRIDYVESIIDDITGDLIDTSAMIKHDSKNIKINRTHFLSLDKNSDFILFLLLWMYAKFEYKECKYDDTFTDLFVLKYLHSEGYVIKKIGIGFLKSMKDSIRPESNIKRYEAINKFINKKTK